MTPRQLLAFGLLAVVAVAGGLAIGAFRPGQTRTTDGTVAPSATSALSSDTDAAPDTGPAAAPAAVTATALAVPNAEALPPDAGGVEGVEQVLLMTPGLPRPLPAAALFEGDELVEERYLQAVNVNGAPLDIFRYLKRNADDGPGLYLCFSAAVGPQVGGGSCTATGEPPEPDKPGSRAIGEDEFLNRVPLGTGMAYVLQVPAGTTHVVVTLHPDDLAPSLGDAGADATKPAVRRVALIPLDGIAVIAIQGATGAEGTEFTAWEGPTLLASARP